MIRVEPSLFSNVITTVQRTSSLTGGQVHGLPGGVVIGGLQGVSSFSSDVADAQKEFQLGRTRTALDRIRQIEAQFQGISGRWHSQINSLISSAKQGRQRLSIQKLNEVKNAQTKMQQLTGPAGKAFQDLVAALEHAVSMEGRDKEPDASEEKANATTSDSLDGDGNDQQSPANKPPQPETPDLNLLGSFAANYRFGEKLQLKRGADKKTRVVPKLEQNKFYFFQGFQPPRPARIRELKSQSLVVFDPASSSEISVNAAELQTLIRQGIWTLASKG